MRTLPLALAASLALAGLAPSAQASVSDTWTHWVSSKLQSDIHSVDFTTPAAVFAASYGDGVFNSVTSQTGPWSQQNSGIPLADQQINQVYASGPDVFAASSGGLYQGTDPLDGGTWTKLGQVAGEPRQLFDAVNSVIVSGNRIVVAAVSGGIMYSDDAGAHWDRASGTDASETAFHIIAVGPALVAGSSSGVYASFDHGSSWQLRSDGLPFASVLRMAVDPTNPLRMYALAGDEVFKVDLSDLAKGALWTSASGAGPIANDTTEGQLPKAMSLTVAPSGYGAGKIFVGSNSGVFATGDSGTTWGKMASATSAEPGIDPMGQQKVLSLALGFPVGGSGPLNLLAGTPHGLFWIQMDPLAKAQGKTDSGALQADATPRPGDVVQAPSETTASQSFAGSKPYFFPYQWVHCTGKSGGGTGTGCTNISGETGPEHEVTAGDVNTYLAVNITAKNIVTPGTIVQPSLATTNKVGTPIGSEPVLKTPSQTYYPTITPSDSRVYGSQYTVTHGTWVRGDNGTALPGPVAYKYRWQRCDYAPPNTCHDIPETTS